MNNNSTRKKIVKVYSLAAKALKTYPTYSQLQKLGLYHSTLLSYFGSLYELREEAVKSYPKLLKGVTEKRKNINRISTDKKVIYELLGVKTNEK